MTASQCEVLRGKLNGRFKKSIKDIEICTQKSGIDTQDQSQQGNVPCPWAGRQQFSQTNPQVGRYNLTKISALFSAEVKQRLWNLLSIYKGLWTAETVLKNCWMACSGWLSDLVYRQ